MPDAPNSTEPTQPTTPPAAGPPASPQTQPPNAGQTAPPAGTGTQPAPNAEEGKQDKERKPSAVFTQEQLNAALARAKKDWQRQTQTLTDEAKREAARKAREEAGEWEDVASDLKSEVQTLTQAKTAVERENERLRGLLNSVIEQRIKDWPPEVLALDPATVDPDNHTLEARWAWVAQAEALKNVYAGTGSKQPGNPPNPPPSNNGAGGATAAGVPKKGTPEYEAYAKQVQERLGFSL